MLPVASESRMVIVELVKCLNTLNTESVLQLVKEVVKRPHQIRGEQVCEHVQVKRLQIFTLDNWTLKCFTFAFIRSRPWLIFQCCSSAMPTSKGACKYLLTLANFFFPSLIFSHVCVCMQYSSAGSAGKCCSSPLSLTGVCSAKHGPSWTFLTAGVGPHLKPHEYITVIVSLMWNFYWCQQTCCRILNDFVTRLPNLDSKKDTRDLQVRSDHLRSEIKRKCRTSDKLLHRRWLRRSWRQWVELQAHLWSKPAGSAAAWRSKCSRRCAQT